MSNAMSESGRGPWAALMHGGSGVRARAGSTTPSRDAAPGEATVGDVMTRDVAVARTRDTLAFAGQVILWRGIRHLPIVDPDGRLVGMLSDADLLEHLLEGPAGSRPVAEFMSCPVTTVGLDVPVVAAARLMSEAKIGALPVMKGDKLVGLLTTSDVLAERGRAPRKSHVSTTPRAGDVMRRHLLTVLPTSTLESAIAKLLDANLRHLVVVDGEGHILGIVSDRDVRSAVGDPVKSLAMGGGARGPVGERHVETIMTRNPVTVGPEVSVTDVAEIFVDERIGAVPVVRADDTVLGMISYVDIIAHFVGRRR